jgi:hypothetical protein
LVARVLLLETNHENASTKSYISGESMPARKVTIKGVDSASNNPNTNQRLILKVSKTTVE